MPHELILSHMVPGVDHEAWKGSITSFSGFHFQWLAMGTGVIFISLFYPTSAAQFLPDLAFLPLGSTRSSVKGIECYSYLWTELIKILEPSKTRVEPSHQVATDTRER